MAKVLGTRTIKAKPVNVGRRTITEFPPMLKVDKRTVMIRKALRGEATPFVRRATPVLYVVERDGINVGNIVITKSRPHIIQWLGESGHVVNVGKRNNIVEAVLFARRAVKARYAG